MAPRWISTKNIHAKDKPAQLCAHSGVVTTDRVSQVLPELAGAERSSVSDTLADALELYPGAEVLRAPMAGTVVEVTPDGVVLEAMKMQHVIAAPVAARALVRPGQVVDAGTALLIFTRTDSTTAD